jgi:hypothetical protein
MVNDIFYSFDIVQHISSVSGAGYKSMNHCRVQLFVLCERVVLVSFQVYYNFQVYCNFNNKYFRLNSIFVCCFLCFFKSNSLLQEVYLFTAIADGIFICYCNDEQQVLCSVKYG